MTYARKTLSEIKLIHGNYGNFIKGQKLDKRKEKKYKTPPYQDLAASNEIDGESLDEKCWPGYEKKGMKTMFGKRYPNCVKKKKTRKEDFSDWRSELEEIEEKKMTKAQIKKRDEIADAISTKDMKDRYGDKNVKYAIATKLAMKEDNIQEILDKKDVPHVKKLVKKLRDGSKTHAKQADDLEVALKTEDTAIESELVIQDWNSDDIKFTEIETVDIIKAKPLKENTNIEEGVKRKIIKKLAKQIAKQLSKKKPKITGSTIKDVSKKYVPPSKQVSQNIQTKSIVNQVKKASELSSKPVKGTKAVKVDVSKPIDFDKYFGGTPTKSIKKKFGSKKPTGTFTDDAPKVKRETLIKAKPGDAEKTLKLIKKYEIGDKIEKKYPGRENAELKKKMFKRIFKDHYDWREELGEDVISKLKMKLLNKKEGGTSKPGFPPIKTIEKRVKVDEDWQKVNRKDKTDGLSRKAVKAYRRENPGSKLQTAVTKDPKKLKKGSKSAKRRLSFCRRMKGMKKKLTSAKTRRDPDSRINKALRRWNC